MNKIVIINGPNLNFLEYREPCYGGYSLDSIIDSTSTLFKNYISHLQPLKHSIELEWIQSNHEGVLIDKIQNIVLELNEFNKNKNNSEILGMVLNPGAYSHTSIALLDSLSMLKIIKVEVHLSNLFRREHYRENLITAKASDVLISGAGVEAYFLALVYIVNKVVSKSL